MALPNYVWDYTKQQTVIGRFGWKAGQPTVLQQTAVAFKEDIGITNYIFNQESCYGQSQYKVVPGDPNPEISDSLLYAVKFYVQTLAVPARRNVNTPQVLQGQNIFQVSKMFILSHAYALLQEQMRLFLKYRTLLFFHILIYCYMIWGRTGR